MTPRFVLAKYVPDLARMEPRNIGVFVWWNGEILARFLKTEEATFVNEPETYERWLEFWNRRIQGPDVRPNRGKPVSKDVPECMDALMSTQKGNYILLDGELLTSIKKRELGQVLDTLFDDLVSLRKKKPSAGEKTFVYQCDSLFRRAGIEYKARQPVEGVWDTVKKEFHPDYYVGNGKPDALMHRAKMSNEQSINSAALIMHAILNKGDVSRDHCRILIRGEDVRSKTAEDGMKMFERLCPIIDVQKEDAVSALAAATVNGADLSTSSPPRTSASSRRSRP